MRYVLLPHVPNPVVLDFWTKNFNTYKHLIEDLVVRENNDLKGDFLESLVDDCPGDSPDDILILMDDDSYILDVEKLEEVFSRLEDGEADVAMISRTRCSVEIREAMKKVSPLEPGAWTQCFFAKRKVFSGRRNRLGSSKWKAGSRPPFIKHTLETDCVGDWMTAFTLEMYEKGIKFIELGENKFIAGHESRGISRQPNKWSLHIGSLGIGLNEMKGNVIGNRPVMQPADKVSVKIAAWEMMLESCSEPSESFKGLLEKYKNIAFHDPVLVKKFRDNFEEKIPTA